MGAAIMSTRAIFFFTFSIVLFLKIYSSNAQEGQLRFELLHLWATDTEQKALSVYRDAVEKKGVKFEEQYVKTNFGGIRSAYSRRVALGIPPSAVAWIGVSELKQFIDHKQLRLVPDVIGQYKFSELLLPELYETVADDGGILAVPLGIHIQNNAIYNLKHLEKVNRPIPMNWREFIETAELLSEAGFTPLSISSEAWQMRTLILSLLAENMMLEEFDDHFGSNFNHVLLRAKLEEAFLVLSRLREFAIEDYKDLPWQETVFRVRDNEATANFLGDYTSPMIEENPDIVCARPPGNSMIIWSYDAIAISVLRHKNEIAAQDVFLEAAINPENQKKFISVKGGIPVHQNLQSDDFNRCTKSSLARWKESKSKVYLAGGVWSQQLDIITNAAKSFWDSGDDDPAPFLDEAMLSLEVLKK